MARRKRFPLSIWSSCSRWAPLLLSLLTALSSCKECTAFLIAPNSRQRIKTRNLWGSARQDDQPRQRTEKDEPAKETNSSSINGSMIAPVEDELALPFPIVAESRPPLLESFRKNKMELMWCSGGLPEACMEAIRERTVGEHNQILLTGPATGQVAFYWDTEHHHQQRLRLLPSNGTTTPLISGDEDVEAPTALQCVLFLIKQGGGGGSRSGAADLLRIAAEAVQNLTSAHSNIQILLDPGTAARLSHYHGVDGPQIHLFEAITAPGFGHNVDPTDVALTESGSAGPLPMAKGPLVPDLICTIGGDGLLMHAGMLFQGSIPPILCVAGGSLGFLTPFAPSEMVEAIEISLGLIAPSSSNREYYDNHDIQVFPPNMPTSPYHDEEEDGYYDDASSSSSSTRHKSSFGLDGHICMSIRLRLDCRIISREGAIKARYNVLNEVVIDRGSSPYLANLECFCDDVHLTTVQADGVIFATPTGSTAYSLAAGSSVVHPAVPCILVTPICPHVLSFRSMVFPDHVVLRCYVPDDARSGASVAFDGKHRQDLHRGDSVQIQMSAYPVPTINRKNHSADWLGSLKRNFNFNARPRQQPL